MAQTVQIEPSWYQALAPEFERPYFQQLVAFLKQEKQQPVPIYPPGNQIFEAFSLTPVEQVRVVILGQDPYHGFGQAHGLSFSVPMGVKIPASLVNIYKELESDLGIPPAPHGNLTHWAQQGVLLLNATLTVRANQAGSHQGKGWESFTDAVIAYLNDQPTGLVFILWGRFAQAKGKHIDAQRHLVLQAAHPSPLGAHAGFWGCKHFSQTNQYLLQQGEPPIDWQLPR
jgi:uracil-DNA glycosylase